MLKLMEVRNSRFISAIPDMKLPSFFQSSRRNSILASFVNPIMQKVAALQCSHQNLQAKGHKYYLMTTPIILNAVIVSTKHLLHASTKHFNLSSMFTIQSPVHVLQVGVKNMLVEPKGTLLVLGQTQRAHLGPQRAQCPLEKA